MSTTQMFNEQFIHNKYFLWYCTLMDNCVLLNRTKLHRDDVNYVYFEKHHILPRSLGGDNKKSNVVLLTAREHYLAHLMLIRFTSGVFKYKMLNAMIRMMQKSMSNENRNCSRSFSLARLAARDKNSLYWKGRVQKSEHVKARITSRKQNAKPATDEYRAFCIERNKQMWADKVFANRPAHNDDTKQKIRLARIGVSTITAEGRKSKSEALKRYYANLTPAQRKTKNDKIKATILAKRN